MSNAVRAPSFQLVCLLRHNERFALVSDLFFVNSTPHLARVTHANILSRVTQAELTVRSLHRVEFFLKIVILTGAFHVARMA